MSDDFSDECRDERDAVQVLPSRAVQMGRRCAFAHDESAREKARAAARDKKAKASASTTNGGVTRVKRC